MIKNNKTKLIISTIAILLPCLIGIILWNKLPDHMATHWGTDGNADGFASKALCVFGLPLILLAVHWLCAWVTSKDPKNKGQNGKVVGLVFWICPVLSLFVNICIYAVALGNEFRMTAFLFVFLGLLFVAIGNYLPKCKQNFTIGIKIKWTLSSEENWNATHRFCGKVWVIGGLLMMAAAFLPETIAIFVMILSMICLVIIPFLYSYLYYKKQVKEGAALEKVVVPFGKAGKAASILGIIILLAAVFICFTGNVKMQYDDASFTVKASYWTDLTVEYEAVDAIEYREDDNPGSRVSGFGSPRLSLGIFRNSEFNNYTRYTYTKCDASVVLTVGEKTLVISGTDVAGTKAIYEELLKRTGL